MSSVSADAADFPLRPLLFAVGAAATAVSIYCYVKKGDKKKTPADPKNTTGPEGPLCKQATEPALVQLTENRQDQMTVSVTEAKEKDPKDKETIAQLEMEKSDLKRQVENLSKAVQDMVKGVFESNNGCYEFTDEREQEARNILQMAYDEMKKSLSHKEEKLKASLAEAEEKHQKAVETIAQLQEENFDLLNKVKTLKDTVQDMGDQLIETNLECDELIIKHEREQEAYNILQEEYNELKETLIHNEELQKVSLAEAEEKHQKAMNAIAQLETEVSELTKQVESQKKTVRDIGTDVSEPNRECDELMDERERERAALNVLQTEYDELKKTVTVYLHKEEILQVSLAEAEEKHQNAVETIAQLEAEKSMLRNQTATLRENVEDVRDLLCESYKQCEQLTKVSLAEVEEKHQKAVETIAQLEEESDLLKQTIAQLEEEKTYLTYQLETLKVTVQDMGYDLFETNRECDELTDKLDKSPESKEATRKTETETKENRSESSSESM
ncbi:Leucine-rich repeat flightless-interacting protein 2 [Bagarius yarrelli]|uniref:Leucine-rich repeat flightless-interacting protein 2 n=1 Tax=Bagarius yarrelli TaxID=175774 RepID=A0A556VWM0_BAGYA|nr:Leucine-rich repeat flightless-interacting protein 2 [Bagarius yarrelli]